MATALAAQKPPLGQKMPQAWSRLENRPLSRRMHREKCRPLVRLASGAPVFANGAVTAAMAYAFNEMQSGGASKRRSAAVAEIWERVYEFREANPGQPIPLSGEELDLIMSLDAEIVRGMYGDATNESRGEFHDRLRAADSDFLKLAGSRFQISGAGRLDGIHRAEDMNYYYVGMVTAASNRSWFLMHGYVEGWNLGQFAENPRWHEIRQIPPAKRWARVGYSYYKASDG